MGSEAISRGPRGGMPVRPNRGEVRSKEAAEESGERKIKLGCGPSFLLCVVRTVICCEFLIALFCPSHPPCMTKLRREAPTACRHLGPESPKVLSIPPPPLPRPPLSLTPYPGHLAHRLRYQGPI